MVGRGGTGGGSGTRVAARLLTSACDSTDRNLEWRVAQNAWATCLHLSNIPCHAYLLLAVV